jgi:OmcA/MtrC family decaheme c-type cytochrome
LTYDKYTRGLLAALLGLSLAACQGEAGPAGAAGQDGDDGEQGEQGPIGPQGPGAAVPAGDGLKIEIQSTAIAADGTVTVTFKATDAAGKAFDAVAERTATQAKNPAATGFEPRFTLAKITADGASQSIYLSATGGPSSDRYGTLAATATASVYTYTFEKKVTVTEAALTHTVGVWAYRNDANKVRYPSSDTLNFVPAGGAAVTREVVADASCNNCHDQLTLHGSRQTVALCVTCHTSQLAAGQGAMAYMAHKIHRGHALTKPYELGGHEYNEITYPQSVANCTACHQGADAARYQTKASIAACGSCHDDVVFENREPLPTERAHTAGVADDTMCATCHKPNGYSDVVKAHVPVVPPDEGSSLHVTGGNTRTNAGWLAAAGVVPPGADQLSADVKSVSRDANKNPVLVFRLMRKAAGATEATPVVFQTYAAGVTEELMPNFTGTTVAYFAFAVPQDGVTAPDDFNVTTSAVIKRVWNGTVPATDATMTGPDAEGYYTVTVKNTIVPDSATILTGGLGYEYSLPASQPFTQTNLAKYPFNATNKTGGLIVPIPNVWKTATGYTARRTIVSNDKCNACHASLGVAPSFHVGQRNDAPTCAFCHNPNRTSSAWSANAKDFVHGIHAASAREMPYTWHQLSPTEGFWQVTFPQSPSNCEACHEAGTYDFSENADTRSLLSSTVGTGTYAVGSAHSPYVTEATPYGAGFGYDKLTQVITPAAATTLVVSPITAACSACHDSVAALGHMESQGGSFYAPRSIALPKREACLTCHGPGDELGIANVHQ